MSERLLDRLPEAFVSNRATIYTRNLTEDPASVVRRNLWPLVGGYFPGGPIAGRTALENAPAADGSVCLVTPAGGDIALPGIRLRPRRGPGPLPSDRPFIGGLALSSTARAYLENMRASRARGGTLPRTLPRRDIEDRLDTLLRRSGEDAVNRLRDQMRAIALGLEAEARAIDELIGTLLGTRDAPVTPSWSRPARSGSSSRPSTGRIISPPSRLCRRPATRSRSSARSTSRNGGLRPSIGANYQRRAGSWRPATPSVIRAKPTMKGSG